MYTMIIKNKDEARSYSVKSFHCSLDSNTPMYSTTK